jgi:hypothetical protein
MEQVVNYKGFDIRVTTDQTAAGKCWGEYQITAASQGAKRVFARKPVSGFGGGQIHETTADRTTNPTMLNRDLVSMAVQEINMAWRR